MHHTNIVQGELVGSHIHYTETGIDKVWTGSNNCGIFLASFVIYSLVISGKIRSNILDLVTMTYKYLIAGLSSPCDETSQAKGLRMDVFYVKIQTDRLCILFSFTEYNKI